MLVAVIAKLDPAREEIVLRHVGYGADYVASDGISLLCRIQRHCLVETREHILNQVYIITFNGDGHYRQHKGVELHSDFRMLLRDILVSQAAQIELLIALIFKVRRQGELAIHEPPDRLKPLTSVNYGEPKSGLRHFFLAQCVKVDFWQIIVVQNRIDQEATLLRGPDPTHALVVWVHLDLGTLRIQ